MCARKRKKAQGAHYLIGFDADEDFKDSPAIVAHVLGLGFNPLKGPVGKARRYMVTTNGGLTRAGIPTARKELALVEFEPKEWGEHTPSQMMAVIPEIKTDGSRHQVPCSDRQGASRLAGMREQSPKFDDKFYPLRSREALINPQTGGFALDFQGRVTETSIKNFQLQGPEGIDGAREVLLQFGKIGADTFTMDVRYPLSPAQAFGIVIASLDNNGEEQIKWHRPEFLKESIGL